MEDCLRLQKQRLGSDHPDTVSSPDVLNKWTMASLALDS